MKWLHVLTLCVLTQLAVAQTTTRLTPYVRAGIGASRAVAEEGTTSEWLYLNDRGVAPSPAVAADLGGNQWLLAGNVGLGLTLPVGEHVSVQAEVNLEQKGSTAILTKGGYPFGIWYGNYTVQAVDGRFTTRLTYLTLPVMASYRVGKLALSAGPYVGFKVSQQQQGHYATASSTDTHPIVPNSFGGYRSTDAGLVVGLLYAVAPHVAVDVRYNQSLRAVTDYYYEGYADAPGVSTLRNQSVQLSMRYYLRR